MQVGENVAFLLLIPKALCTWKDFAQLGSWLYKLALL